MAVLSAHVKALKDIERRNGGEPVDTPQIPEVLAASGAVGGTLRDAFEGWNKERERPADTVHEYRRAVEMFKQLTYAELGAQSDRLAGFLATHGVGPGDIVTICLPNWCATVVAFLATMKRGAIVNPVPVTYGRADIVYVLTKCDSRALFVAGRFRSVDFTVALSEIDAAALAGRTIVRIGDGAIDIGTPWAEACAHAPNASVVKIAADEPTAVLFTSGTESRSKGAVHTHNTILFGERALSQALAIGADDVAFMPSPISSGRCCGPTWRPGARPRSALVHPGTFIV